MGTRGQGFAPARAHCPGATALQGVAAQSRTEERMEELELLLTVVLCS